MNTLKFFMLPSNLAFVDIETTGLSTNRDRIIEIAVLRVERNKLVRSYTTLLNPHTYLSPAIQRFTGITNEELENAPSFSEVKEDIIDILEDAFFVAHNVRFDYGFIRTEFKRLGLSFSTKHFCTVKFSKYLYPHLRAHNLDSIINTFHIPCLHRHRALDDTKVIWDFYNLSLQNFPEEKIQQAIDTIRKSPSRPINVATETLEHLPESPGVYIFYGQKGAVLYIGKSVNIKERVVSHFAADHTSPIEMKIAQQIESIETITTVGELGALLKESYLIKKLQPLYNRRLRRRQKVIILTAYENKDGYQELHLQTVDKIDYREIRNVLGVFRSQKQAKEYIIALAKDHSLCEKLVQLEKTHTACFAYRLGKCKGACIGKENPLQYNMRFIEAFSKNRIIAWPFPGPIIIKEKNELDETIESFLVDKWCLLGKFTNEDTDAQTLLSNDYTFDLDTYKILLQHIKKQKNNNTISIVSQQAFSQFSLPVSNNS